MSHTNNAHIQATPLHQEARGVPLVDAEADSVPRPAAQRPPRKALRVLLGLSLVLIAANLRPVFSSVSVLLPEIAQATGMSSFAAGVLTTLPVVCLGVFAPFAPRLAQRFGAERVLLGVLVVLAAGTLVRGFGPLWLLFAGTTMAGAAIATANVLLPGVVKRDFPKTAAIMTGLYTMALWGGAASAAGFTVPVKAMLGGSWNLALAVWSSRFWWCWPCGCRRRCGRSIIPPMPVSAWWGCGKIRLHGRCRCSWGCNRPAPTSSSAGWLRCCGKGD